MGRTACLVLVLVGLLAPAQGQPAASPPPVLLASDAEVTTGIELVEAGEYNKAILTLDNAARRLAQDPAQTSDLSQAYLYLGIAYLGKGHEAAARARFREALACAKDLSLSPGQYPPKVIDLFEAARDDNARRAAEAARVTPTTPASEPTPSVTEPSTTAPPPAAPAERRGGSRKWLIGGGVAAAAVVGGVVAASAGGDEGGGPRSRSTAGWWGRRLSTGSPCPPAGISCACSIPHTRPSSVRWS